MMRTMVRRAEVTKRTRSRTMFGTWEGVASLVVMAILTRIQLLGDVSPFPAAFFTAGLFTGLNPVPMLIGCAIGTRYETLSVAALMPVSSLALSYALFYGTQKFMGSPRLNKPVDKPRLASMDALCLTIAGIATLLPGILISGVLEISPFFCFASAAVAMLIAPVLLTAQVITPSRKTLLRDEQMALMLLFLLCLTGVRSIPLVGTAVAPYLAAALTLVAGGLSPGTGAMVGVLTGTALTLMGDNPVIAAFLGLCGLLSGMVGRMGRPASAVAFALGSVVAMCYGMSDGPSALHPLGAGFLSVAYAFAPEFVVERLWKLMETGTGIPDANRFIRHARENAEYRVRALAAVFDELHRGYGQGGAEPPEERALIGQMRKKLCAECTRYERCWMGESHRAHHILGGLLADALRGAPLSADAELPNNIRRACIRGGEIPRRLSPLLMEFDRQKRTSDARADARGLAARHFQQASEILNKLAGKLDVTVEVDVSRTRVLRAVLDKESLAGEAVALKGDGGGEFLVRLENELWTREIIRTVEARLTRELGVPIREVRRNGTFEEVICFAESPRFAVSVGVASRPLNGAAMSGDNCAAVNLSDGLFMLALSDGMGHGERAARESATTIHLLKGFLEAEVRQELALDAVNSLINRLGGDEMYATVDLCVIDLKTGKAEINKLGACHTTLLRKNGIAHIEGGRLPLGILEKVASTASSVPLAAGDLLVMVSDGVADSALDEDRAFLDDLIRKHRHLEPQALCAEILKAAQERTGRLRDDMTAMAARIVRSA